MSRLSRAVELCADSKKYNDFMEGLKIFNDLIMNTKLPIKIRTHAIVELSKIAVDEGNDKIARIRDCIPFLKGPSLETEMEMLTELSKNPQVNPHERMLCAMCLYNNLYIEMCYDLFKHLANDISMIINYRVEACKYLLYSEISEYVKSAKKCIMNIIKDKVYPSDYRYKTIAGFISNTGLFTLLNREKLVVDYDEKFLYHLQTAFFFDAGNGVRERILSGQHILSMNDETFGETNAKNKRDEVIQGLKQITTMTNDEFEQDEETCDNIRADAADVILRLGDDEQQNEARETIRQLGFLEGTRVRTLVDKQQNVYSDRQNVHDTSINKSVNAFLESLPKIDDNEIISYFSVHSEVTDLIYKSELPSKKRIKAFKSLNRISIDTATFTETKITTVEVFVHVWRMISNHNEEEKAELRKRTIEELVDMADTCSSGHAARLVNILSGYDVHLSISWKDQLCSNIAARMQKKIQDIEDETLQENVVMGMTDDCDTEERNAFLNFVSAEMEDIRKQLFEEFVGAGHINEKEFNEYFKEGVSNWV